MSRPKTVKPKSRPKTPPSKPKHSVEPAAAAKVASSDSTPDESDKTEHRAEAHKEQPENEQPWSEWQWCEAGQMCYRGRKDPKGEWEYDIASLPKEKEKPYTPPRQDPIEYLIDELRIIWQPLIEIPDGNLVAATPASTNEPSTDDPPKEAKKGVTNVEKVDVVIEEEKPKESEKPSDEEEKESTTTSIPKPQRDEKPKKERRTAEKRGRQLERKHFNQGKEKVDQWRKTVE